MSENRHHGGSTRRAKSMEPPAERETVPVPLWLPALFVLPLVLLAIWAVFQN